ncbi:MAG: ATP-binding protein [Blastocatellia bacterium]
MIAESFEKLSNAQLSENPFPGLRPFELHEGHLFFGREGQSEKLLAKLEAARFLAVVGTSGSGKSSLVRAGLVPALFGGMMVSAGSNWRVALMRPSNNPIGNLARALSSPEVFGSDIKENAEIQAEVAEATLRRGNLGLVEAVRLALQTEDENLLVVVDQFEELFRFAREAGSTRYENDAAAFVKLLLEPSRQHQLEQEELRRKNQAIESSLRQQKLSHEEARREETSVREAARKRDLRIYVVLTMRSDFLGDCAKFWDLPEAVNESQYLIPRLTRDQLREAIAGPVAVGGGQIAPRLVNQLLNDIGDNQDQLPVLQHALMRTWDEWKRERESGGQGDKGTRGQGQSATRGSQSAIHYSTLLAPHSAFRSD